MSCCGARHEQTHWHWRARTPDLRHHPRDARAHQGLRLYAGRDGGGAAARAARTRVPGERCMNPPTPAATVAPLRSLPGLTGHAGDPPLTRVSLAYVEQRFNLYLRFGEPARIVRLNRSRRVAVFLPGALFCRVHWQANDYGTTCWQLMVMQVCARGDVAQRIPGVQPGARLLLHADGARQVQAVLPLIDAIEARGI